jgi:hypothetical protein
LATVVWANRSKPSHAIRKVDANGRRTPIRSRWLPKDRTIVQELRPPPRIFRAADFAAFLVDDHVRSISEEPSLTDRDPIESFALHGFDRIAPEARHRTYDNVCHTILTPSHPPSRQQHTPGDYSCTQSTACPQNLHNKRRNTCCPSQPDNCNPDAHTSQFSSRP